jgi:hypothetical protein
METQMENEILKEETLEQETLKDELNDELKEQTQAYEEQTQNEPQEELEDCLYIDTKTKTIWQKDKDNNYECGVCAGDLTMCRGCGGMSIIYPDHFGCCSTKMMCPNCISLKGPENLSTSQQFSDEIIKEITVDQWNYTRHEEGKLTFVRFSPLNVEEL